MAGPRRRVSNESGQKQIYAQGFPDRRGEVAGLGRRRPASPKIEEHHHGLRAAGAEAVEGDAVGRLRRTTAIEDGAQGDTRLQDHDGYEEHR